MEQKTRESCRLLCHRIDSDRDEPSKAQRERERGQERDHEAGEGYEMGYCWKGRKSTVAPLREQNLNKFVECERENVVLAKQRTEGQFEHSQFVVGSEPDSRLDPDQADTPGIHDCRLSGFVYESSKDDTEIEKSPGAWSNLEDPGTASSSPEKSSRKSSLDPYSRTLLQRSRGCTSQRQGRRSFLPQSIPRPCDAVGRCLRRCVSTSVSTGNRQHNAAA
jgi:hypothetical protein